MSSKSQDCGNNESPEFVCRHGLPHPDCEIQGLITQCVRIKFHYVNNTGGQITPPNANDFFQVLNTLNHEYAESQIKFSFDGECIHFVDKEISTSGAAFALGELLLNIEGDGTLLENPDPDLEYLPDFINVYFIHSFAGVSVGWYNPSIVATFFPTGNSATLIHEIGHTLGLAHTSRNASSLDCLCKNPNAIQDTTLIPHCETTQDCLCDTGLDPYDLSIDGDSIPDGPKWVTNCTQSTELVPSIPDGCNDTTTAWEIPYKNFMSYYANCRQEFSPCQISLMHDILELEKSNLLATCHCEPIIINSDTSWANQTKYLCPGQKIQITKKGSLRLENTILTIDDIIYPQNPSCPELGPIQLWDGIYIEGKKVIPNAQNIPTVYGNLFVLDNSVIEFSENGINAPIRFGRIFIDSSTIQNCGRILNARDTWPFSFPEEEGGIFFFDPEFDSNMESCGFAIENPPSSIRITNSTIRCENLSELDSLPKSQIKVSGSPLYVNNSSIINNSSEELTAITQSRGRLSIVNGSKIEGFNFGALKGTDIFTPCLTRGLVIDSSSFKDCVTAIENNSNFLFIRKNRFEGRLITEGICYQYVYGNKFLKTFVESTKPIEASIYDENFFDTSFVNVYLDNSNTMLGCNIWNSPYAVDILNANGLNGDTTKLPKSWGSEDETSGNKRKDTLNLPIMSNYEQFQTNFLHFTRNISSEKFYYFGDIEERNISAARMCSYSEFPPIAPLPNPNWIDHSVVNNKMEMKFDSLEDIIGQLEYEYSLLTGQPAERKLEVIQQKKILQGSIVGETLQFLTVSDSLNATTWLSRANPLVEELSSLYSLLYRQDFTEMLTILTSTSSEDADVLYDVVSWLDERVNPSRNIFNCSVTELDTLTAWAKSSYGDYTNLLRSFLMSEYDIHVHWPDVIVPRNSRVYSKPIVENTVQFMINPNPSSGCFEIHHKYGKLGEILITLYDLGGQLIQNKQTAIGNTVCFSGLSSGMYVIQIDFIENGKSEMHLFVKI